MKTLDDNLVGTYLHGSIAFPRFEPQSGDIDFYAVVRRALNRRENNNLDDLHRSLTYKFQFGKKLDGFYIPLTKARKRRNPSGLVYAAKGRLHRGGFDDSWSLHRVHFHSPGYIALQGPAAGKIFPRAFWPGIRNELYKQLHSARNAIDTNPGYAVLSLCRLVYNFQKGNIAVSKMRAAEWGTKNLPSIWRPLVRSAIRDYRRQAHKEDRLLLRAKARRFLGFASLQMIALDPTDNPRSPAIKYLRKTSTTRRRAR